MNNMNKNKYIIISLVVVIAISLYFNIFSKKIVFNSIFTAPNKVTIRDTSVTAEGSWVDSSSSDSHFGTNELNSVSIYCEKTTMICKENVAKIDNLSSHTSLYSFTNEYEVTEWDDNHIKAVLVGLGQIFEIIINLNDKSASFTSRDNPSNPTASNIVGTAQLKGGFDNN